MILPTPATAFEWVGTDAGSALVCRPLADLAAHLFTTRHWRLGSRTRAAADDTLWDDVARALGVAPADLMRVRQVHGARVAVGRHEPGQPPEADILVARDPNLVIAVQAADCVPLLVADCRTGAVAAAHAGWRGLAARAPLVAVAELGAHCGSRPADLVVAVGPSIGPCCYEVGSEVRARFTDAGFSAGELARWFLPTPPRSARNVPMNGPNRRSTGERWYLDMWSVTCAQLLSAGVPPHQTFVAELCTASHPDTFCSYRRDGRATGRISGAIRPARPQPERHRETAPRY